VEQLNEENTVVVHDACRGAWLLFSKPEKILEATSVESVLTVLYDTDRIVRDKNKFAAGFVSYEASPAFDSAFPVKEDSGFPLAWFGIFSEPRVIAFGDFPRPDAGTLVWEPSITREEYSGAIRRIKDYLREGDTYQVNYTFRLRSNFEKNPLGLFTRMLEAQQGGYGAFINTPDWVICSASPELFFELSDRKLVSRPMKGTAPRRPGYESDLREAAILGHCEKNRAENLMIVDMVRNDMGRISDTGSVCVPELYEVEKYPSMWQMTSTVCSRTDAGLAEIFRALFPPASITGAPKARTMEIISELESSPRRIYTGSIGFLSPDGAARFNVAIRTVLIDKFKKSAEFGVGGGIVWDSADNAEFEECMTKASILTRPAPEFSLLETMLWEPGSGYSLLDRHLERLSRSASYFDRKVNIGALRERLVETARSMAAEPCLVRLIVPETGEPSIEKRMAPSRPGKPYCLCIAHAPVDSGNPFLYHKTTYRPVYEEALAASPGYDDVLLFNDRGEITESCRANVVVEMNGRLLTPPVSSGILPGVYRSELLEQGRIEEKVIGVKDLARCSKVYLINSVRGMWEVIIDEARQENEEGALTACKRL